MNNTLEYAQIFQEATDIQAVREATSGWMEANAKRIIYNGGKEVKLPMIELSGLGNYDREKGYSDGTVDFKFQTETMTQDRGRSFMLDAMDVDETNFALNATALITQFQNNKVIPEIDCYRYSKLYKIASENNKVISGYTPSESDILSTLLSQISEVKDIFGQDIKLVITMSSPCLILLNMSEDFQKVVNVDKFNQGEIYLDVKSINECPIIRVSPERLKTEYKFFDGKSENEKNGGYEKAENAKQINWIICPKTAPIAISKAETVNIITPQENQKADAWQINYRRYHDLWYKQSMIDGLKICTE